MSKERNKNYGKSIRAKLLNVAKKEGIFYQTILTRYFQERLLYRMSQTRYRNNFYLKGGALMYAYERFAARPTLDIDFLGNNISNGDTSIIAAFKEICSVPFEEDGVVFDVEHIAAQNITEFKDYHGIRLSIPVKMDSITQVLTMDIGFGDVVTPSPVNLDFPILLEHLNGTIQRLISAQYLLGMRNLIGQFRSGQIFHVFISHSEFQQHKIGIREIVLA